jgi:ribonuclease P protein component
MKNTLKNKADIDNLFSVGKYLTDKLITIKWINSSDTKVLFAVSSKNFKKAVDRNRIKRLMRESVSNNLPTSSMSGKYIAFIFRGNIVSSFEEVNKSIKKLLFQLN